MKRLIQFLQEDNSKLSMTRLTTFILVCGGLAFGYVYPDKPTFGIECILLGLGLKAHQRFSDNTRFKK